MARDGRCAAIYLFTNGYLGGGDYGTWTLELDLLTLAIRAAGRSGTAPPTWPGARSCSASASIARTA